MSTVTTEHPVNLTQLGAEVGGSPSFRAVGPRLDGTITVSTDDVDQATLDAAIAAHVAQPQVEPEPVDPAPSDATIPAAAVATALATITPTSTMANVRTALIALRTVAETALAETSESDR